MSEESMGTEPEGPRPAEWWSEDGRRLVAQIDQEIRDWESGKRPEGCTMLADAIARCLYRNKWVGP